MSYGLCSFRPRGVRKVETFIADHPFMFMIYRKEYLAWITMFFGRYSIPNN